MRDEEKNYVAKVLNKCLSSNSLNLNSALIYIHSVSYFPLPLFLTILIKFIDNCISPYVQYQVLSMPAMDWLKKKIS